MVLWLRRTLIREKDQNYDSNREIHSSDPSLARVTADGNDYTDTIWLKTKQRYKSRNQEQFWRLKHNFWV